MNKPKRATLKNGIIGNPEWLKGKSGNPAGKKPRIYTVLKQSGFTKEDVKQAFAEVGWQTQSDLQAIVDDENKPMILKVVSKAFLEAVVNGDYWRIKEIMEHVIGKPKESHEVVIKQFSVTLNLNGPTTDPLPEASAVQLPETDTGLAESLHGDGSSD